MSNEINLEHLPYGEQLPLILGYLKLVFPEFPRKLCVDTSRLVKRVTGIPVVAGFTYGDSHAWNYDTDRGLFIDLTARQFDPELPEILVTPETNPRFSINKEYTRMANRVKIYSYDERYFLRDYYKYAENPFIFGMENEALIMGVNA